MRNDHTPSQLGESQLWSADALLDDPPTDYGVEEPRMLRVLLVEDDPADVILIERSLRRMNGYVTLVTSVADSQSARHALSSNDFDLVIVDYLLDADTGIALLPYASIAFGGCPSILVTTLWSQEIETEAREFGACACLPKSELTPRAFETVIRQALHIHDQQQQFARVTRAHGATAEIRQRSPYAPHAIDIQVHLLDFVFDERKRKRAAGQDAVKFDTRIQLSERPVYVLDHSQQLLLLVRWIARFFQDLDIRIAQAGVFADVTIQCRDPVHRPVTIIDVLTAAKSRFPGVHSVASVAGGWTIAFILPSVDHPAYA